MLDLLLPNLTRRLLARSLSSVVACDRLAWACDAMIFRESSCAGQRAAHYHLQSSVTVIVYRTHGLESGSSGRSLTWVGS